DYDAYLLAQTFHPRYPSLAILTMVERHRQTKEPSQEAAIYSVVIDHKFSGVLIPIMNSAFNDLDPTGQERSQHIQEYHAKMTYGDLVKGMGIFVKLVARFKRDGQLANIAVDYDDPLIRFVATLLRPTVGRVGNIHWIPRTQTVSDLQIPIRNPDGGIFAI